MESSTEFESITQAVLNMSNFTTPTPVSNTIGWLQIRLNVVYAFHVASGLIAVITNVINITVFLKGGLTDSVTVSFLALSVSDLMHTGCISTIRILTFARLEMGYYDPVIRTKTLGGIFGWTAISFMDTSMFITLYLTLQKVCCIVFPFAFQIMFTVRRSVITIILIYIVSLIIFYPVLSGLIQAHIDYFKYPSPRTPFDWIYLNVSRKPIVWVWVQRIFVTISCQVLTVVGLVIITTKLKKAVKFRQSSQADEGKDRADESSRIGLKEQRAIQAVRVLATVFMITTTPATLDSVTTLAKPSLEEMKYQDPVLSVLHLGININAVCNIFIYLKYNHKYRAVFTDMFCQCRKE